MRFALLAMLPLVACAAGPIPPGPVPRPAYTPSSETVVVPIGYRPVWVLAECNVTEVLHTDLKLDGQVLHGETLGFVVRCPGKPPRGAP